MKSKKTSQKINWKRIIIVIVCILLAIPLIFCHIVITSDLCWNAAAAQGLNPNEMVWLTWEERQAIGGATGMVKISKEEYLAATPTPSATVDFREHFLCHTLKKPSFAGKMKLYFFGWKQIFNNLLRQP